MMVPQKYILSDAAANEMLSEAGYVVFPLLDGKATHELLSFYHHHHPSEGPGMSASAHAPDIEYRKLMSETIRNTVLPALESAKVNVEILGGSFISKAAGTTDNLAPHQDWNITDESYYRSFNLWIPLVNSGAVNGGIMVLPRSHRMGLNYRGPSIPSLTEHIMDAVWKAMVTLEIPAGHALLYDHRLIHASGPNNSEGSRIVAVLGALEKGAPMHIYYGTESGINIYSCTPEFFLEHNPNEGQGDLPLLQSLQVTTKSPDAAEAISLLQNAGVAISYEPPKSDLPRGWAWLKRLFG